MAFCSFIFHALVDMSQSVFSCPVGDPTSEFVGEPSHFYF